MKKPAQATNTSPLTPMDLTKDVVTIGPKIAPVLPPAAMKANSLVAWLDEKVSAINVQNTDMRKRLITLNQQ